MFKLKCLSFVTGLKHCLSFIYICLTTLNLSYYYYYYLRVSSIVVVVVVEEGLVHHDKRCSL